MGSQDQHEFLDESDWVTRQATTMCVSEAEGGPCETATKAEIAALTGPVSPALAATALHLARHLDKGAGLATAATARELRATILALTSGGGEDDGTLELLKRLSTPVLNGPQPVPGDVWPASRRGGKPHRF
jgi:hypothetical protein